MNLNRYLDWQFRPTTWVTLVAALVCLVCAFVLPESFGDKNSPIENVQMLIVAVGLYVTCSAKERKYLYVFASLCLFFIKWSGASNICNCRGIHELPAMRIKDMH